MHVPQKVTGRRLMTVRGMNSLARQAIWCDDGCIALRVTRRLSELPVNEGGGRNAYAVAGSRRQPATSAAACSAGVLFRTTSVKLVVIAVVSSHSLSRGKLAIR